LPLSLALKWAHATQAACKVKGFKITALYLNADFDIKPVIRDDGVPPATVEVARRKAYTAVKTGMNFSDYAASQGFPPGTLLPPPVPGKIFGLPPGPNPDINLIIAGGGFTLLRY
jgi:uncharacterized protein GlcG (DUF336 family)